MTAKILDITEKLRRNAAKEHDLRWLMHHKESGLYVSDDLIFLGDFCVADNLSSVFHYASGSDVCFPGTFFLINNGEVIEVKL